MKILQLIETGGPGGAEKMLLRLATEFRRHGIEQLVGLRKDGWLAEQVRQANLELWLQPLIRRADLGWLRAARRLVREHRVSAIICHEFAMNFHGTLLARITGLPSVSIVHGRAYFSETLARRAVYRFVSRFGRLVAVSEDIRELLVDQVGADRDRVLVVPNGIDPAIYQSAPETRMAMRSELGIREGTFVIGAVGSLYPVKGHKYLIEAVADLKASGHDLVCLIVGRGQLEEELRILSAQLDVNDRVKFLGFRDDVPRILSALDVFVLPSLSEGLPLSLLEASASGVPVVASRVGGIPEFVENGKSGLLAEPADASGLGDAIETVAERRCVAAMIGEAHRRVVESYSLAATAARYLQILGIEGLEARSGAVSQRPMSKQPR